MGLYGGNIKELQKLLVGKSVVRLDPLLGEGLCKFVLSDGSQFDLCANELGFWVENSTNDNQSINNE